MQKWGVHVREQLIRDMEGVEEAVHICSAAFSFFFPALLIRTKELWQCVVEGIRETTC